MTREFAVGALVGLVMVTLGFGACGVIRFVRDDDRAKPAEVTTQSGAVVTCPAPFKDIGVAWSCKDGEVYVLMNAIKTFKRACSYPCDEAVR